MKFFSIILSFFFFSSGSQKLEGCWLCILHDRNNVDRVFFKQLKSVVSQTAETIQQLPPQPGLSPSLLLGHGILWWILYGGSWTPLKPRQLAVLGGKKMQSCHSKEKKWLRKSVQEMWELVQSRSRSTWLGWASSCLFTKTGKPIMQNINKRQTSHSRPESLDNCCRNLLLSLAESDWK